jgi:hypothetical protein
MEKKFPYGKPEEIEKKRALEFMALSLTEKYESLMKLIKINYEVRMSNKDLKQPSSNKI